MGKALIVVDVQNDFCEGGSLAVVGGGSVAVAVSKHAASGEYEHVVATRDYHIDPGDHFSDEPDFVTSWPRHCVAGTAGASFHPELDVGVLESVFSKGQYSAGYSGFEGVNPEGGPLSEWLRDHDVDEVEVAGIATEHCVRATALDAVQVGFNTTVLLGLTAGISPPTVDDAVKEFRTAGIRLMGAPSVL